MFAVNGSYFLNFLRIRALDIQNLKSKSKSHALQFTNILLAQYSKCNKSKREGAEEVREDMVSFYGELGPQLNEIVPFLLVCLLFH